MNGWKPGAPTSVTVAASYELKVAKPTFTPAGGGTQASPVSVIITSATPGATLYYTTDGSEPRETSMVYSTALLIGTTTVLKAIGFKASWTPSDMQSSTYTVNFGTLSAPIASPSGGVYSDDQAVALHADAGATIRYTLDGLEPAIASALYSGPVTLSATTTLKAKAFQQDWTASPTFTGTYTIQVAAPVISPPGGVSQGPQVVSLTSSTARAEIRFTVDGSEPMANSPLYTGPFSVAVDTTVKAKAFRIGCDTSPTTTAVYAVDTVPPTISASVAPPPNAAG